MSTILSDQLLDTLGDGLVVQLSKDELILLCQPVLFSIHKMLKETGMPSGTDLLLNRIYQLGEEALADLSVKSSRTISTEAKFGVYNPTGIDDDILKRQLYPQLVATFLRLAARMRVEEERASANIVKLYGQSDKEQKEDFFLDSLVKSILSALLEKSKPSPPEGLLGKLLNPDTYGYILDTIGGLGGALLGKVFSRRGSEVYRKETSPPPSQKSSRGVDDPAPSPPPKPVEEASKASEPDEKPENGPPRGRGLSDHASDRSANGGSSDPIESEVKESPRSASDSKSETLNQNIYSGFSPRANPKQTLDANHSLQCNTDYLFWLEISEEEIEEAVDTTVLRISAEQLVAGEKLLVVLYGYDDQFQLDDLADVGELEVKADKRLAVARQPIADFQLKVGKLRDRRLFFPVKTQQLEGVYRLDCHLYYKNILVQARSIQALVKQEVQQIENAIGGSEIEYRLASLLSSDHLKKLIDDPEAQQKLSINLNESAGSHNFQFFGEGRFKKGVTFGENEINTSLEIARNALRKVSWGSAPEPNSNHDWSKTPYRYQKSIDPKNKKQVQKFTQDLAWMAREGFRIYDKIFQKLDPKRKDQFERMMKTPGYIQIALKQGARTIMPFAMIYDYMIDTALDSDEFKLCEQFMEAWQAGEDFKEIACFKGNCPHQDIPINDTICPSGFWGFRHFLGFPHSVSENVDTPVAIEFDAIPTFLMAVSTDKNFKLLPGHRSKLEKILNPKGWIYTENRNDTIRTFAKKETQPHLVYFYCHGGYLASDKKPYLQLGDPETDRIFTPDQIMASRADWSKTTPLVFLNGCHTTGLNTGILMDFVGGFVQNARSAGVVGTEITIFEPLATAFAHAFFSRFLTGESAGRAIRNARLDLLQEGNPLGLVYIPYLMPGLRMIKTASA